MERINEGAGLKYLFDQVKSMIGAAEEHGGTVYGVFVINVIIRILSYNFSPVRVSCVDIWFKSYKDKHSFITNYPLLSNGVTLYDSYGDIMVSVNCVVSEEFPCCFIDIENVIYKEGKIFPMRGYQISVLMDSVRKKRCVLTEEYYREDSQPMRALIIEEISRNGWKAYNSKGEKVGEC